VPFWAPLIAGAFAYGRALEKPLAAMALATVIVLAAYLVLPQGDAAPLVTTGGTAHAAAGTLALFVAGLKGGLLTFGGAYTAIPYVRADTVGRGWLTDGQFLDGIALGNLLPAPLVIFATFVGYVAGGLSGALAVTAGMFLPAFGFSLVFFERLEHVVDHPRLQHTLDGVAAAAVGVIAATLVQLGLSAWQRLETPLLALPIFFLAALAAWRLNGKWVTPAIVAAGAAAGAFTLG
jgi:chromate transporter